MWKKIKANKHSWNRIVHRSPVVRWEHTITRASPLCYTKYRYMHYVPRRVNMAKVMSSHRIQIIVVNYVHYSQKNIDLYNKEVKFLYTQLFRVISPSKLDWIFSRQIRFSPFSLCRVRNFCIQICIRELARLTRITPQK